MAGTSALVAGGSGFIGSHLCERLLDEGYYVYCLDNFGSGRRANVSRIEDVESFELIESDVRRETSLPPVDEVYHFASRASPTDFTEYPVKIALTNTQGTKHLLEHTVECNARMLFASTSEVYGDPEVHPQDESYSGNVNIRGPRGCYDESKRFGETLTVAYHKKYDIDIRTVRIFNTYGPRMRHDDGRVIPNFLSQVTRGEDLTVYGDGTQTRSFCFIDDLIGGIWELMTTDGLAGDVVNLGSDHEVSIKELAETVIEIADSESQLVYEPRPEDDPEQRRPDLTKARRLLDFEPEVDLETGLERTLAYFEATAQS